jgi:hypothetical protein
MKIPIHLLLAGLLTPFAHQVNGIPSVITCDLTGKIVSRTRSIAELEPLVK